MRLLKIIPAKHPAIAILLLAAFFISTSRAAYIGRLDNGMEVVLVENHSVPMIVCNIVIKAGARDESYETWGAAHFLEHLLFNGTINRTQEEIYAEFDRIGAYHNAHTGSHFVDFMLLVSGENFPTGFEILTDMIFNSTLPPWKFDKERGIVMEELAQSKAMRHDSDRFFREALYAGSPLSRPVLGSAESIELMERDSVLAFYRRWYAPNNMLLFASGNFAADTLFDWLQGELSNYRPRELAARRKIEPPDFKVMNDRGIVLRQGKGSKRTVFIAMNAPQPGHSDFPAFYLLKEALNRHLEEDLPPGSSGGSHLVNDPDFSVFEINLTSPVDGASTAELLTTLDKVISELAAKPPDPKEINQLARRYRADRIFNAEMLHHYGIMYAGDWALVSWDEFDSWHDRMAKLTPAKLQQVTRKWLLDVDRFVMALEPVEEFRAVETTSRVSVIERFAPDDGTVLIVQSDPSAQVFALHILVKNRYLYDREFGAGAVDLLHQLLDEASDKNGVSLTERLDELTARLKVADNPNIPFDNYYTTSGYSFIRLEILPDKWREGIKLIAELLTDPPLTADALERAREQASAARRAQERSSVNQGRARLRQHLFPGTALSASVYGDVSNLTLDDLRRLRDRYFQPRNMIVSVAGPVDPDSVNSAIRDAFKRLSTSGEPLTESQPFIPGEETYADSIWCDTLSLGRGQGAVVMGRIIPEIDSSDIAALIIANGYFNDRMGIVLRETLGLAYSLGSSVRQNPAPDNKTWGYWELYIATREENIERAEECIHDLIAELADHAFTDEEVERLRNAVAGRLLMRSMPRIGRAYAMGTGEFYWHDPEYRDRFISALSQVSAQQVEDAARKYLPHGAMSTAIVK